MRARGLLNGLEMTRQLAIVMVIASCEFSTEVPDPPPSEVDAGFAAVNELDAAELEACPGYATTSTGRYRFVETKASWEAARGDCADDGTGTHLVVFGSDAERLAVTLLYPTDVWIGLSDRVTTGTYRWVTDEDTTPYPLLTTPPWKAGQPNDGGGGAEDCIEMESSGFWDDRPCTGDTRAYVCECDGIAELRAQSDPQM